MKEPSVADDQEDQSAIPAPPEQSDPYSAGEPQPAPRQRRHVEHKDEPSDDRTGADPATGYQYNPETKYDVQGVYDAATKPQDFQKPQAPIERSDEGLQRVFGPNAVQDYATRAHAIPAQQIQQIDESNGGSKDPMTVYRSVGSLQDPTSQYGYLMGKAKMVDTATAIAQSLSAGEHGPPNFPGAANALNEAAKATPDGNHVHVTSAGDNTVFNVSPVDQAHNVKTLVVPNQKLASVVPAFGFDSAMSGKLVPALEQAHQSYVDPAQVPVVQRDRPAGPASEAEQSSASYNPSTYQQMLDRGGQGLVKAGGPEDNAAHAAMNEGYANREANIRNQLAAHPTTSTAQQEAVNARHKADRDARAQEAMRKAYMDERTRDQVHMDQNGRFTMVQPAAAAAQQPGVFQRILGGEGQQREGATPTVQSPADVANLPSNVQFFLTPDGQRKVNPNYKGS